jgi:hypothetical protein
MTGPLPRPIREYESVRDWDRALRQQWGGDPLGEEPEKLETLTRFCEFSDRDPDEWLAFCFLRKRDTGVRFGSTQRRKVLIDQVAAFRDDSGLSGLPARRFLNDLLSFFIHGGVLINAGAIPSPREARD